MMCARSAILGWATARVEFRFHFDCHMAMGQDTHLAVKRNETTEFPLLRDHYIRILHAATERFLGK